MRIQIEQQIVLTQPIYVVRVGRGWVILRDEAGTDFKVDVGTSMNFKSFANVNLDQ